MIITLGSVSDVCEHFDVSEPMFLENVPILISHRLQGFKVELISVDEFRKLHGKIAESDGKITLV